MGNKGNRGYKWNKGNKGDKGDRGNRTITLNPNLLRFGILDFIYFSINPF